MTRWTTRLSSGSADAPPRLRPADLALARGPQRHLIGWLFVAPALAMYAVFVLLPLVLTFQYSLYRWDGIGPSQWVGLKNYVDGPDRPGPRRRHPQRLQAHRVLLIDPGRARPRGRVGHASHRRPGASGPSSRTVLFLPQIIPLVAAGIAWKWVLSASGLVNQILSAIGLDGVTRAWLGDFDFALPAVGIIGAWVLIGLCTILLLTGMSKIDTALYESARLDGAGAFQEFRSITLPSLRQEIGVCITVTVIAALASFDIVYIATGGGPGLATTVPGSRSTSSRSPAGRSDWHPPWQWSCSSWCWLASCRSSDSPEGTRRDRRAPRDLHRAGCCSWHSSRSRSLPFLSLFGRAAAVGLDAARDRVAVGSRWGNFVEAFNVAQMPALLLSSVTIVIGVVPVAVVISTMAGFAIGHLRIPGGRVLFLLFLLGLTLPFEGIITPLYYLVRGLGHPQHKWAVILPLIGLYMPFAVFWMRAHFINMPRELSEAARVDGATHGTSSGAFMSRWRGRRSPPWPSSCRSGPGTSSCSRSSSWKTHCNGRWPVRSAPTRATTPPTSRCSAQDRS